MNIEENLSTVSSSLPEEVVLVAVSKKKPNSDIMKAYDAGHRVFGENRVQELIEKYEELPKDIQWHVIGQLQRNKVKYIAPFVSLIHSVDTVKLLNMIEAQGEKCDRVIDCLLQIHIAEEDTKSGFTPAEVKELLSGGTLNSLPHVNIIGLMGMASYTEDQNQISEEFQSLKSIFDQYPDLGVLSMGMSGDYSLAIEEGSNMVRVGSLIFGERN
ncbi:MAG: YggS family pyridoxal phosphate-dependent enzyme [Flavobacteriales bacterium]|nr:YggS family pyridoxal phosphate-dependent enzyme [Flavobacteriales bacterium]